MTCGIYMIQNKVNGKIYIGQSVNIEDRWADHKSGLNGGYHINKHLKNAWNKYGESNFEFTVICECEENQLNTMEEYYIFELMVYDPRVGYNKTYGGDSGRHTEETKQKISESKKGENHHMFGKHHSEETKKKLSESNKGENNPMYGKHLSEETKRKISENSGSRRPEVRKKMSLAHKGANNHFYGKHHSEETKRKISEANKSKYCGENNPMYGKHHNEETKRKMSIPIVQIAPYTNKVVNVWGSATDAKRKEGFNNCNIINCCKGNRNTHGGYKWMYLKDWLKEHNRGIPKKLYFID